MLHGHELDAKLATAKLFAWLPPTFQLLKRHWLVLLGAGVAVVIASRLIAHLSWSYVPSWWEALLHAFVIVLATSLITVVAYREVARDESEGTGLEVNELGQTIVSAVQIAVVWTLGMFVVAWLLIFVAKAGLGALLESGDSGRAAVRGLMVYGIFAVPLVVLLLTPLWATLGVAGSLSTVHAVRSLENGLGAVLSSLRLAFGQMWRVFWHSYLLSVLWIGFGVLLWYTGFVGPRVVDVITIVTTAIGIAIAFVIERAYVPDLGLVLLDAGAGPGAPPPSPATTATGSQAPGQDAATGAAYAAAPPATPAAPAAATADIVALIEQDLRTNRTQRLVTLVERGLAADPRFFTGQPDSTIALAKRVAQADRPDLALRLLQPYVKEQRGHRHHLTGALLAANILARDPARVADVVRYLEQVKALHPDEPMVDQLLKTLSKARVPVAAAAKT